MRLTDKGERWMLVAMGYGRAALLIVGFLAVLGIAGWIEGMP